MKKYNVYLSVLISSLVFLFVSCTNAFISKADLAKKRNQKIVSVTYDVDGGDTLEKTVYDFTLGANPSDIPTPHREDYIFGGWYTKKSGGGKEFNKDYVLTDNLTVYAKWDIIVVTVTYDVDGGDALDKNVYEFNIRTNPNNIPVPKKEGYIFGGWYTQRYGNGTYFDDNYVLSQNITVYAKWNFNSNYNSIEIDYSKALSEDGVTFVNASTLTSNGYVRLNDYYISISGGTPGIVEDAYKDFDGYYDADGIKVCDSNRKLLANAGNYTDSYGRWILDLNYTGKSVTLYPRWIVHIKATTVTLDSDFYEVGINEEFTITGSYSPANATTTIKLYNVIDSFGDVAVITEPLECSNGRFSIKAKAVATGTYGGYIQCIYNNNYALFTIKSGYIKTIDPNDTISNIELTYLSSKTVAIPYDPPSATPNFTVNLNQFGIVDHYNDMLSYSIENGSLILTSLGEPNYTKKTYYGVISLRITDTLSGKTKIIKVSILPPPESFITITSIPDHPPANASEIVWYDNNLADDPPKLYSVSLKAGKGYCVRHYINSMCYAKITDTNFEGFYWKSGSGYNNIMDEYFVIEQTGTYYLKIYTNDSEPTQANSSFYIYEFEPVTEIILPQDSITIESGQTVDIPFSYTPANAYIDKYIYNYSSATATCSLVNNNTVRILGRLPGNTQIQVRDNYTYTLSLLNITVTLDPLKEKNITLHNTPSYNISDYEVVNFSSTTIAQVYKIQMEEGKTYHFQIVDSAHAGTGVENDKNGKIASFSVLKDDNYNTLLTVFADDMTYSCTTSGLYYYMMSPRGNSAVTGNCAFYVWAEDTP